MSRFAPRDTWARSVELMRAGAAAVVLHPLRSAVTAICVTALLLPFIVGVNLIAGSTYLFDFLVNGEGEGTFTLETDSGLYEFPDPNGDLDNVLVAFRAEQTGWTEISLRRTKGSFDLHSVEVTLAVAPQDQEAGTK